MAATIRGILFCSVLVVTLAIVNGNDEDKRFLSLCDCYYNPGCCIHGICNNHKTYRTCDCQAGYKGSRCDQLSTTIIGQCSSCHYHPECCVHGECKYHHSGYRCECRDGYAGEKCDVPPAVSSGLAPQECSTSIPHRDCAIYPECCIHGFCEDHGWFHQCRCIDGYSGHFCDHQPPIITSTETAPPKCSTSHRYKDCKYHPECCIHGECGPYGLSHRCECTDGYSGDFCDHPPPATATVGKTTCGSDLHGELVLCMNGHCAAHSNFWNCDCNSGWTGKMCETRIESLTTTTVPPPPPTTTTTPRPTTSTTHIPTTTSPTTTPSTTTATTTTTAATTTTTVATTTVPSTTTTLQPYSYITCGINSVIYDISKHTNLSDPNAVVCPHSQNHNSHEALVLQDCTNVPTDTSTWQPGTNVGQNCKNIPQFTAIAAFYNGQYSPKEGLSGIFVQCNGNGFEMAVQTCEAGTDIVSLTSNGINLMHPDVYYTIQG